MPNKLRTGKRTKVDMCCFCSVTNLPFTHTHTHANSLLPCVAATESISATSAWVFMCHNVSVGAITSVGTENVCESAAITGHRSVTEKPVL